MGKENDGSPYLERNNKIITPSRIIERRGGGLLISTGWETTRGSDGPLLKRRKKKRSTRQKVGGMGERFLIL